MSRLILMEYCARLTLLTMAVSAGHPAGAVLKIDPKAEVHPTAVLMGNVTVGPYSKIGPKVAFQGDVTIGHHTNLLGFVTIHADQLTIGNYVRIDYGAKIVDGRPAAAGVTAIVFRTKSKGQLLGGDERHRPRRTDGRRVGHWQRGRRQSARHGFNHVGAHGFLLWPGLAYVRAASEAGRVEELQAARLRGRAKTTSQPPTWRRVSLWIAPHGHPVSMKFILA